MSKVWEFFEYLNEYVYVTDVESHEIVYMNRKMLDEHGYDSLDDVVGKKCHDVLNGQEQPCAFCDSGKLISGHFREWCTHDTDKRAHKAIYGGSRQVIVRETLIEDEGRKLRLGMAFDLSGVNMEHDGRSLEAIVNNGLRLAMKAETPNKALDELLEYLGKALHGERTYIFEKNADGGDDNTYEWVAEGVTAEKDNLQNLPPEVCANWYDNFTENKNIIIEDLEDIKESDSLQYENLKRQNIHAIVVVPLYENGKAIGFFGVDNPPAGSIEYAENMLQITGHFMVSTLKRRNLVSKLAEMSFTDQLTELGNRHAMTAYTKAELNGCEKLAVVFCDITGLKRVNDTKGHEAGDEYIINACTCLREAFGGTGGLFRMGGDELLALCPNIEKSELDERIALLRKLLDEKQTVMAVGAEHRCDNIDIDEMLTKAETFMYADKAEYYKRSGIERRTR